MSTFSRALIYVLLQKLLLVGFFLPVCEMNLKLVQPISQDEFPLKSVDFAAEGVHKLRKKCSNLVRRLILFNTRAMLEKYTFLT